MAACSVGGNSQTYQILLNNFQSALSSPVSSKCTQLAQLFQDSSLKDLRHLFATVVESVFGFRSKVDWGLLVLHQKTDYRDFNTLKCFLAPDGPLLQLAYKLLEDRHHHFEFPVSCLPAPSRHILEEGTVPMLYANKLQFVTPGSIPSFLQLNAFEYFIFHFAFYIVNSALKNASSTVNQADTLYACLLEDYFSYFLPADGSAVPSYSPSTPSPTFNNLPPASPFKTLYPNNNTSWTSTPEHLSCLSSSLSSILRSSSRSPARSRSSLLKPGTVLTATSTPSSGHAGTFGLSQVETWRSEAFVMILAEIYLNQSSVDYPQNSIGPFPETFVPSHYHVWMVRILIKHLHYFSNSSTMSNLSFGQAQMIMDTLAQLKSCVVPQFIQKKMFSFLKLTFDHWPLDASFRVPLETWLSYIQPWRYTTTQFLKDNEDKNFQSKWQKFVSDNVPFYSTLFLQVLQRFFRMDLSCPKNAYMLFRVTKVFSQEDLGAMIAEAERNYIAAHSRNCGIGWSRMQYQSLCASPYSSDSSLISSFRQQISETEISGFNYVPMFSDAIISQVSRLLAEIVGARERALIQVVSCEKNKKGFLSQIFSLLDFSSSFSEDYSSSDIKKVDSHLEAATNHFCHIFQLTAPAFNIPNTNKIGSMNYSSTSSTIESHRDQTLTVAERLQLQNGNRKLIIAYQGNPDLQPVRTFEFGFLVKMLGEISEFLNIKYGSEIKELYYRSSIVGRMCQQILAAPVVYQKIVKSKDMVTTTRTPVHLPPRVNLRQLANRHLVGYLAIFLVATFCYGFHPMTMLLLLVCVCVIVIFIRALWSRSTVTNLRQD